MELGLFEVQYSAEPEQWATIETLETRAVRACQCVCVLWRVLHSERLIASE